MCDFYIGPFIKVKKIFNEKIIKVRKCCGVEYTPDCQSIKYCPKCGKLLTEVNETKKYEEEIIFNDSGSIDYLVKKTIPGQNNYFYLLPSDNVKLVKGAKAITSVYIKETMRIFELKYEKQIESLNQITGEKYEPVFGYIGY